MPGYIMMGKVIYGFIFLLLIPLYLVDTADGVCKRRQFIDWSNYLSLHNWVEQMNLDCFFFFKKILTEKNVANKYLPNHTNLLKPSYRD